MCAINRKLIVALLVSLGLLAVGCRQGRERVKVTTAPRKEARSDSTLILPDFKLSLMGGSEVSVRTEVSRNKLTILDFWASWCGPCREEMPEMVALFNKYHGKGLGIIGLSLDEDEGAWKAAVSNLHMSWIQSSDLKGWDSYPAQLFGIESIPYTIVVSQDGEILETGLRGEALQDYVKNYFNE